MADQVDYIWEYHHPITGEIAGVMETSPLGDRYNLTVGLETMYDIDSYWLDFKLKTMGFDPREFQTVGEYCEDHQTYHKVRN